MSESDGPPRTKLDAFDAVYEREFSYVWKTVGRFGVASADIADAVHDVYVVAYRRWAELEPGRPVRPWLFGIARRVAAGKRRRARDVLDDAVERASTGDADRLAQRDLLWRLLSELPDERLEVVILHDLEGLSGADIAAVLGISVNTVHSRLRLARCDLADTLARLGEKKR
ncbi:MAG TPA: sigma-70 family RNA polymerase sigma factor [Gemmatimonadaceae bacterium]